jgi:hypothetical protein
MKNILLYLVLMAATLGVKAQSCEELMQHVKSKGYGSSYTSFNSDAISKVTFYDITIDYKYYHFAIVCFKRKNSYSCDEYIYQVGSNTKFNYSSRYLTSAGQAFWDYIQPYNENLGCAPDF